MAYVSLRIIKLINQRKKEITIFSFSPTNCFFIRIFCKINILVFSFRLVITWRHIGGTIIINMYCIKLRTKKTKQKFKHYLERKIIFNVEMMWLTPKFGRNFYP